MDTWSVCELVMDPPLTTPPVVALVWGLVSWATRDRRGQSRSGSREDTAAVAVLVAVRSPIAWAVLFIAAKKVLVLPDMTPISLRANERILPAG